MISVVFKAKNQTIITTVERDNKNGKFQKLIKSENQAR